MLPQDQRLMAALTTERSFNYFREGNRERRDFSKLDWDGLISTGYVIAGDPDNTTPTYLQLATGANSLLASAPSKPGSFVTVFINPTRYQCTLTVRGPQAVRGNFESNGV